MWTFMYYDYMLFKFNVYVNFINIIYFLHYYHHEVYWNPCESEFIQKKFSLTF